MIVAWFYNRRLLSLLRPGHTRQQVTATCLGELLPTYSVYMYCVGNSDHLCQFVTVIWHTNSNQFQFVPLIVETKSSYRYKGNCPCDLSLHHVGATCHLVCPDLYHMASFSSCEWIIMNPVRNFLKFNCPKSRINTSWIFNTMKGKV